MNGFVIYDKTEHRHKKQDKHKPINKQNNKQILHKKNNINRQLQK